MMQFPRLIERPAIGPSGQCLLAITALLCSSLLSTGCGKPAVTEAGTPTANSTVVDDEPPPSETTPKPADKATTAPPAGTVAKSVEPKIATTRATVPPAMKDDDYRKQIVGKWRQNNAEKRTITVNADGTATIVAELSDVRQYIVGKLLRFDLEWQMKDGTLTFITLGGDPAESIKYINAIYGKTRSYRIREFSTERLLPQKVDTGEIEPEWTRLTDE